jgi:hypothetical protein
MLQERQICHLSQRCRVPERAAGRSFAMCKETLHAIGIDSICAKMAFIEPATEISDDPNLASDRMSRVILSLKPRDELVDMRAQRARVHTATVLANAKKRHGRLADA